jgi:PilZ domain
MEQRAAHRRRLLKAGSIEFDGTGVDCTVRNISMSGAGLEVANPVGIPHEITLLILTQHVRQHCYIVWRKENRLGVMFDP